MTEWLKKTLDKIASGYDPDDWGNRIGQKVEVKGLKVSTVAIDDMPDCSYETALIDAQGVHPVERYQTRPKAEAGHAQWVKKAESVSTIIELGDGPDGVIKNRKLKLRRRTSAS